MKASYQQRLARRAVHVYYVPAGLGALTGVPVNARASIHAR